MKHFPIFIALEGRRVVLSGGGEVALAKLRLLMKTEAQLIVFAPRPAREINGWAAQGHLTLLRRALEPGDAHGAALFYAADDDPVEDARTSALARADGALVNIVDNLTDSQFITAAIVDRDPVIVAVGTEGAAPVLARAIKADIEAILPITLGPLARAAHGFRARAETLPSGRVRRTFWSDFLLRAGPEALARDADVNLHQVLETHMQKHLSADRTAGHITFATVTSHDPELLAQKTHRVLHEADLVLHTKNTPPAVLELARREARFDALPSDAQPLIDAARRGEHVICLCDAAIDAHLITACHRAGVSIQIIPGIAPTPTLAPLEEIA